MVLSSAGCAPFQPCCSSTAVGIAVKPETCTPVHHFAKGFGGQKSRYCTRGWDGGSDGLCGLPCKHVCVLPSATVLQLNPHLGMDTAGKRASVSCKVAEVLL